MSAHTEDEFNLFMSQLKETNQTLDFFCDFDKINNNVEEIKLSLCILNSMIGSTDLRKSVETIWNRDKSAFSVMDILIAVRKKDKKKVIDSLGNCIPVEELFNSVDSVMEFLEGTGLAEIFTSRKVKDLVDYVFGVEVGLDTHTRKNRIGTIMASNIAHQFDEAGIIYQQEVVSKSIPSIKKVLGKDSKRFDFVIKNAEKEYLIEVNYYGSNGSKVTEIPRSYMEVAKKINSVSGYEFVWITDGPGWEKAKEQLHEAYNEIPHIYNLTTLKDFIKQIATIPTGEPLSLFDLK